MSEIEENVFVLPEEDFVGIVQFWIHEGHPAYSDGMRGGYVNFAARGNLGSVVGDIEVDLCGQLFIPFSINELSAIRYLDRLPTDGETSLLSKLDNENDTAFGQFHLYPADA